VSCATACSRWRRRIIAGLEVAQPVAPDPGRAHRQAPLQAELIGQAAHRAWMVVTVGEDPGLDLGVDAIWVGPARNPVLLDERLDPATLAGAGGWALGMGSHVNSHPERISGVHYRAGASGPTAVQPNASRRAAKGPRPVASFGRWTIQAGPGAQNGW